MPFCLIFPTMKCRSALLKFHFSSNANDRSCQDDSSQLSQRATLVS